MYAKVLLTKNLCCDDDDISLPKATENGHLHFCDLQVHAYADYSWNVQAYVNFWLIFSSLVYNVLKEIKGHDQEFKFIECDSPRHDVNH